MKLHFWLAALFVFLLALRNATDMLQPWFSNAAMTLAMSVFWLSSFWIFKIYGLALEKATPHSVFRALMEYGLPALVLFSIVRNGNLVDYVLAIGVWWLIGGPCRQYRELWRPHAKKHVNRLLEDLHSGIGEENGGYRCPSWWVHLMLIMFGVVVASVSGGM